MFDVETYGPPLGFLIIILVLSFLLIRARSLQRKINKQKKEYADLQLKKEMRERKIVETRAKADRTLEKEKLKTERALLDLEQQKEIAKIAASVTNEQSKKLTFFLDLAQEFQAPMMSILGELDNLLNGDHGRLPAKIRSELETVVRSSRQLKRLMDQFHDISKLQTGQMELTLSRRDLVKFTREILSTFSWYVGKKQIKMDLRTSAEQIDVIFDFEKMAEVFYHLLSNAIRLTPTGGRILVSISEVSISPDEPDEDFIEIKVRNSGETIPEEKIPFLFDMFHQTDDGERPEIGLSLAKELISLHGGSIRVRSETDIGTEFTITMPRSRASVQAVEAPVEAEGDQDYDFIGRAKMELSALDWEELSSESTAKTGKKVATEDQ
jgi:signal transduction histidine kinase